MTDGIENRPPLRLVAHADVTGAQMRSVDCLAESTGLSRERIKQAMTKGAVWLTRGRRTQRLRRATRALQAGDQLHLYYDERVLASTIVAPRLIADEGTYSVWCKPCGVWSQGSKWGDHCTVMRWAERHLTPPRSAFTVHRLDRAATGLILIAHQRRTAAALASLFRERRIEKRYRVLVRGQIPLAPSPYVIDAPLDGRAARTDVTVLGHDARQGRSLLDVRIESGRKHQIRRHLADIGAPVVGDRLHGDDDAMDLQLVAYLLVLDEPHGNTPRRYELPESLLPTL